jgi:hypothetical protein
MPNTVSIHYKKIWSLEFINRLDKENKMLRIVNRSLESDFSDGGNIITRPKNGAVSTAAYVDGSDMSVTDVVSTDDTLTLDQQRSFLIHLERTELTKAAGAEKIVKKYADQGVYQLNNDIESHILSTMATEVAAGHVIGTTGAPITLTKDNVEEYLIELGLLLDEDNIPMDQRVYVLDPSTVTLMRKAQILNRDTALSDEMLRTGKVGNFNGAEVVQNNNITATSGVKNLFMYHKDLFFDIVVRINPGDIEMFQLEKRFGKSIKGLALYGSNSFHPAAGAMLKKAS